MLQQNWTEVEEIELLYSNRSVFIHSTGEIELQFQNTEVINQNFALTPFNIICNIINNVTVFIVNIMVLVCLKNQVKHPLKAVSILFVTL